MKKDAVFSVKGPSGQSRIAVPLDSLSLASLKDAIEKATKVASSLQELRFGYPPQLLADGNPLPNGGSITLSVLAPPPVSTLEVVRRVVPANNSCLFSSFAYCLLNRSRTMESARQMRAVVATEILAQPDFFSEPVLGKEPQDYCRWIKDDNAWGGSIEIVILSTHFECEVAVMDVQTTRMDLYEGGPAAAAVAKKKKRMYLLYDGVHYDPFAVSRGPTEAQDECLFDPEDAAVLEGCKKHCKELHDAHSFVDTSKFNLRCLVCGAGLTGEADAIAHAGKTSHTNFAEYLK